MKSSSRILVAALVAALLFGACGTRDDRGLGRPLNIAVAPGGVVLVTDFLHNRILAVGPDGEIRESVGERGFGTNQFWSIVGVESLANGGFVVVNQRRRSMADVKRVSELKLFDASFGEVAVFTTHLHDSERPIALRGVAHLPDGRYVVGDQINDMLRIVGATGEHQGSLGADQRALSLDAPAFPRYHDGAIWFTEYRKHRVRAVDLEGRQRFILAREGTGATQFLFPTALDVSPDGWIVVADLGNSRLQRYDLEGNHLGSIVPEPASSESKVQILDVRVGPTGNIYAVDSKGSRVLVFEPDGTLVRELDGRSI